MKPWNAPSRTLCFPVFLTQDEHRAAESLYQSAGYDADYAAMPSCSRRDEGTLVVGDRRLGTLLQNQPHDLSFGVLPLTIQRMKLSGSLACACQIRFKE